MRPARIAKVTALTIAGAFLLRCLWFLGVGFHHSALGCLLASMTALTCFWTVVTVQDYLQARELGLDA